MLRIYFEVKFLYVLRKILVHFSLFKVYSTSGYNDRRMYYIWSGHICICLFYTTPVSCLEIRIKKQCFAIFIYFGLVYAEGLNKNCMKLSQKKNYVWNLKTVQKTIDIGFKTIFTFKLKYLKTLPCVNLIKIKPTILNRFESR